MNLITCNASFASGDPPANPPADPPIPTTMAPKKFSVKVSLLRSLDVPGNFVLAKFSGGLLGNDTTARNSTYCTSTAGLFVNFAGVICVPSSVEAVTAVFADDANDDGGEGEDDDDDDDDF